MLFLDSRLPKVSAKPVEWRVWQRACRPNHLFYLLRNVPVIRFSQAFMLSSTSNVSPVMKAASGLARKATAAQYPVEYFYPYPWFGNFSPDCIKENTHCIHYWGGPRRKQEQRQSLSPRRIIGRMLRALMSWCITGRPFRAEHKAPAPKALSCYGLLPNPTCRHYSNRQRQFMRRRAPLIPCVLRSKRCGYRRRFGKSGGARHDRRFER